MSDLLRLILVLVMVLTASSRAESHASDLPQLLHLLETRVLHDKPVRDLTIKLSAWLATNEVILRNREETVRSIGHKRQDLSSAELKLLFHGDPAGLDEKGKRGTKLLLGLLENGETTSPHSKSEVLEVIHAVRNNLRLPGPGRFELLKAPVLYYDYANNPMLQGRFPAKNICSPEDKEGRVNPAVSSFWTLPKSISRADLFRGFDRKEQVRYDHVFRYKGPKTSYGGCPGFEIKSDGVVFKVKLEETRSEPFTARIFHAMGYNVDPTDHAASVKIRYDRRLLREFDLRKEIQVEVTLLGLIPVPGFRLQEKFDPLTFFRGGRLKNGDFLNVRELKKRLFKNLKAGNYFDLPGNYQADFESQIDYLETQEVNIQPKSEMRSIGPWEFGGLGHEDLRELRGAGILAAWTGWFDARFDNTRLKVDRSGDVRSLRHYFSDLGGGLGKSTGVLSRHCEEPNAFPWTCSSTGGLSVFGGQKPPEIIHFELIEDAPAFEKMTLGDARWMLRLMAQLTENQIRQALIAAGFEGADARLFCEKLVHRRDCLMIDFGLAAEVGLLRPNGIAPFLNYDPEIDEQFSAQDGSGRQVETPPGRKSLVFGKVQKPEKKQSEERQAAGAAENAKSGVWP